MVGLSITKIKKGLLLSLSVKEMFEIGKKVVVSFDLSLICATAQYTAKRRRKWTRPPGADVRTRANVP